MRLVAQDVPEAPEVAAAVGGLKACPAEVRSMDSRTSAPLLVGAVREALGRVAVAEELIALLGEAE